MGVKLVCNNHNLGVCSSLTVPDPFRPQRYSPESWLRKQESVNKDTENLAGTWSFHVKEMIKCRGFNKEDVTVHVVKEGETLSSGSNQCGVSVNSIAATNRKIVDLCLGYEGKHIKTPSVQGNTIKRDPISLPSLVGSPQRTHKRISRIFTEISKQNNHTMLIHPKLQYYQARTTGYFLLVLVPLIAICIRCINGARITVIKPKHPRVSRWKTALSEIREFDNSDPLESNSNVDICSSEEQDNLLIEETSSGNWKLEKDYEKFLLECGITTSGYWRGGDAE